MYDGVLGSSSKSEDEGVDVALVSGSAPERACSMADVLKTD